MAMNPYTITYDLTKPLAQTQATGAVAAPNSLADITLGYSTRGVDDSFFQVDMAPTMVNGYMINAFVEVQPVTVSANIL